MDNNNSTTSDLLDIENIDPAPALKKQSSNDLDLLLSDEKQPQLLDLSVGEVLPSSDSFDQDSLDIGPPKQHLLDFLEPLEAEPEPDLVENQPDPVETQSEYIDDQSEPFDDQSESVDHQLEPVEGKPDLVEHQPPHIQDQLEIIEHQLKLVEDISEAAKEQPGPPAADLVEYQPPHIQDQLIEHQLKLAEDRSEAVKEQSGPPAADLVENQSDSIDDEPEHIEKQNEPIVDQPDPVENQSDSIDDEPEPIEKQNEPIVDQPDPVENQSDSIDDEPEPIEKQNEPIVDQPELIKAQPSTSALHHGRVGGADLSISALSDILHWKDPLVTGIVFTFGLSLILSTLFFSIISVIAYHSLAIMTASLSFRLYRSVMQTMNKKTPIDEIFDKYLVKDITVSTEKTHEIVDIAVNHLNDVLIKLRNVLLLEDKIGSLKFALFLYTLLYVGSWFNGITLIFIVYLALFSVPRFYELYKPQIDQYLNILGVHASTTMSSVMGKVSSIASSAAQSATSAEATTEPKHKSQ